MEHPPGMQTFIVGGAVRDSLLGMPVQDRDWVVVGATPEDMLAQGFRPVGKDFPVFLHPQTQEEYALARTERKTAPGYRGFVFHTSPDVKLEDDLVRRDLTINAIARAADGSLVDPFGGQADLQARVFRHVSNAFLEDPVRILRLARFAARFPDFTVAPETNALMRDMVKAGEVDALVAERVWQELARGLMEKQPSRMFEVLRGCGALARIMPELDQLWGLPQACAQRQGLDSGQFSMSVINYAAQQGYELAVRFAALMHGHEQLGLAQIDALCARLKVPNDCRELALVTAREYGSVGCALELPATALVKLFERSDAFRKPQRFIHMLQAAECNFRSRHDDRLRARPYSQPAHLMAALDVARAVNAGEVAARHVDDKSHIPEAVRRARASAVGQYLNIPENGLPEQA